MKLKIYEDLAGSILDIGGGGECVIGQIFGDQVIAIDNRQEELDEAPNCCEKRLMDATELLFEDYSFDNVTFFYSLMYMSRDTQIKAIHEAMRVLKRGGKCYIWDTDIQPAYPEPFIIDLDIVSDKLMIHTSYGIVTDEAQDADTILKFTMESGIVRLRFERTADQFLLVLKKA
ncbi:MAG: class I SAM-dependent methyltransferase [Gallicola sp.]|nr:class I SAM-dependent methyltransferase [Gallicola sp.]